MCNNNYQQEDSSNYEVFSNASELKFCTRISNADYAIETTNQTKKTQQNPTQKTLTNQETKIPQTPKKIWV